MVAAGLLRKFIVIGLALSSISEGYIFGQLTGMISTMLSEHSDVSLTPEQVSWIVSIIFGTGVLGFMVSAMIIERFGRKLTVSLLNFPIIIYWITLYYAHDYIVFMVARAVVGVFFGGVMSVVFLSTAEYTNPHERASYLTLITSLGPSLGGTAGNLLFTRFHWRTVALFGIIPTSLATLLPFFWVESPSWLASQGRFEECETSFRALHGNGPAVQAELRLLIAVEKRKQIASANGRAAPESAPKRLLRAARKRYFWSIGLLTTIIIANKTAVGKVSIGIYLNTILLETVGHIDAILLSTVDGCVIIGCCLSSICMRRMTVRGLLFTSGFACTAILTALSLVVFFTSKDNDASQWARVSLLAIYFLIMHLGIFPLCESVPTEMFPLDIKDYCTFIFGLVGATIMFMSIKLVPSMISTIGCQGFFALNAGISLLTLLYLWFYLPETKGRTLQEIELYFKNGRFDHIGNILNEEGLLTST